MKKIIAFALVLIILLTSLISCGDVSEEKLPDGAVPVLSNYYNLEYILPGEYDTAKFEDGTWARNHYSTIVSEVNGDLAVMPSHRIGSSVAPEVDDYTVYSFDTVYGSEDGVFTSGDLIIAERCVGMIHSYSKNKLLVFTTAEGNGSVYCLEKEENGEEWLLGERISVAGAMYLVYYKWESMFVDAPKKLYIVTSDGVSILNVDEYLNRANGEFSSIEIQTLESPEWWIYIRPTSAAETSDGTVWIGEREGVVGIAPDGSMKYYPIDYPKAISRSEK